ncbi:MAG: tetratricopeptide repeat protein [Candidatus Accumulibacter sp.]|jgi:tetratricopeptide (TPR) repeat protein|nr:tetratricopeptide repeat protein [Accumulibacter sp.]
MFPIFPKPSRVRLRGLITGCVLAVLSQLADAQTLADIQSLMKEGKMTQALERVDRYIAAQPRDVQGPFTKGMILSELGRPQEAIKVFIHITETFPELPEPYNNLAVLYAQQKQYDKAQTALEMAIRTHPSYAIAHENLGDVYAKLASQAYDKALQLDSSNTATQTKLSMIGELISVSVRPGVKSAATTVAAAKTNGAPVKMASAEPFKPPVMPIPTEPATAVIAPKTPTQTAVKPDEDKGGGKGSQTRTDAGAVESEIAGIVRDWAGAWSRKDVTAYLAFYASDFQTPNGMKLAKWEAERRQRIDKPGKLQVNANNIKVSFSASGDTATARFRQQYTSATLKTQTNKTLVFVKSGNRWRIQQERVG